MAIERTGTLTDSIRARYTSDYLEAAMAQRLYDQLAMPVAGKPMSELIRGSSAVVPFLSDMEPGTAAISEVYDITPQVLADTTASITPTSRGEAMQCSELLLIQAYTDYGAKRYQKVGQNMMESIDLLAMEAAIGGSWRESITTRDALDAGTTTHYCDDAEFAKMQVKLTSLRVPGFTGSTLDQGQVWAAIMPPEVFHDIRLDGNVLTIGQYVDPGIHLNFELGKIGPFRLVVSPWAKIFFGAASDSTSNIATTLASAASALDTTITVAATTNIASGTWLTIGTEESGSTYYPKNERVKYIATTSTTGVFTILGEGPNGGLRFSHDSGTAVRNADSAYSVVYGGPSSLAKLYAPDVGEYGQVVGPKYQGFLDQFVSLGWKFYGGYGRISESWLIRGEYATSFEA